MSRESSPRVVVGLGNPGAEYENTRHNVGFWFVDYLAHQLRLPDMVREGSCLVTAGQWEGAELLVVKPLLYMNRSGHALARLWRERPFRLEELLVCYDEADLPAGRIRIRGKGSAAGHRGMSSVLEVLGTREVARLRFGVGGAELPRGELADFVLGPFRPEEENAVLDRFPDALEAVRVFYTAGIEAAMGRFNG